MSAPTKTPRISRHKKEKLASKAAAKEIRIPWREVFKDEIEKYSEAGLVLKGCRSRDGMTQKDLAKELGIRQSHISEMENGKRPIGKVMAKRLAKVFKTDYRVFL